MLLDVLFVSSLHLRLQTFSCTTMNIYTIWDKISNLCNILCSIHSLSHMSQIFTLHISLTRLFIADRKKNFSILVSFYTARHYAYWYFQFTRCFSSIQYIFFLLFFYVAHTHSRTYFYLRVNRDKDKHERIMYECVRTEEVNELEMSTAFFDTLWSIHPLR